VAYAMVGFSLFCYSLRRENYDPLVIVKLTKEKRHWTLTTIAQRSEPLTELSRWRDGVCDRQAPSPLLYGQIILYHILLVIPTAASKKAQDRASTLRAVRYLDCELSCRLATPIHNLLEKDVTHPYRLPMYSAMTLHSSQHIL
jgi:hypothetical protein